MLRDASATTFTERHADIKPDARAHRASSGSTRDPRARSPRANDPSQKKRTSPASGRFVSRDARICNCNILDRCRLSVTTSPRAAAHSSRTRAASSTPHALAASAGHERARPRSTLAAVHPRHRRQRPVHRRRRLFSLAPPLDVPPSGTRVRPREPRASQRRR